jgi:hypothetical protein
MASEPQNFDDSSDKHQSLATAYDITFYDYGLRLINTKYSMLNSTQPGLKRSIIKHLRRVKIGHSNIYMSSNKVSTRNNEIIKISLQEGRKAVNKSSSTLLQVSRFF